MVRKLHHGRKRRRTEAFHAWEPGREPGTLTLDPAAPRPTVRTLLYSPEELREVEVSRVDELRTLAQGWPTSWVIVEGLGDTAVLGELGERFGIHHLVLEDILNTHHPPKVELHEGYLFIVVRLPHFDEGELDTDQISILLGRDFVLSFEERDHDLFDPLRARLRSGRGHPVRAGADQLAYRLLDVLIDRYYPVLDRQQERLDQLEEEVLAGAGTDLAFRIQQVKRELVRLRRAIWPLREALSTLLRDSGGFFRPELSPYLRDCYDHVTQIIDLIEAYRELASDLTDVHLSTMSNRLNEVMKMLTMIATIFIPLSFIAGVYGMNFDTSRSPWNMPELSWYWGYPFALGLMGLLSLGMLYLFWRKGWLGSGAPPG